ncbi:MAG: hypothetical protein A3J83_02775 [Elusimicrobia bacterium RIFOXYA2_FULL_40_6]|nr:MAG: hypothetical protein A3J83_02775 [Elusimicrobia bacterium RIFOXYA2_FULL_40_6]
MNKSRVSILILTAFAGAISLSACKKSVVTQVSNDQPKQQKNEKPMYSNKPMVRVESSDTTPELWKRRFSAYEMRLKLDPEFPSATDYVKIDVTVMDLSQKVPVAIRGAKIACIATMPNMPGNVRWMDKSVCYLNEKTPGTCSIESIVFGVGGDWDLIVKAEVNGRKAFTSVFPIEVKGPPWPANYIPETEQE